MRPLRHSFSAIPQLPDYLGEPRVGILCRCRHLCPSRAFQRCFRYSSVGEMCRAADGSARSMTMTPHPRHAATRFMRSVLLLRSFGFVLVRPLFDACAMYHNAMQVFLTLSIWIFVYAKIYLVFDSRTVRLPPQIDRWLDGSILGTTCVF